MPNTSESVATQMRDTGVARMGPVLHGSVLDKVRSYYDAALGRRTRSCVASEARVLLWVRFSEWENEVFKSLGAASAAHDIAAAMFPERADDVDISFRAFMKPAACGAETPWHQDIAYADQTVVEAAFNLWIALDDCDVESGAMQYMLMSHLEPTRQHLKDAADSKGLTLIAQGDFTSPTSWALSAGDATAHDWRTLHYSGPNLTCRDRRALVVMCRLLTRGMRVAIPPCSVAQNF